jgi:signal transduction histidine kinase
MSLNIEFYDSHYCNRDGVAYFKQALVLFIILFPFTLSAQQLTFTQLNDANGLPSSEVYQIVQDKQGFIWIATDAGVARFDGERIDVFNKDNGLPDPVVFGFYETGKRIWLRSFSGALSYLENDSIYSYVNNSILEKHVRKSIINSLAADSLGNLWVGTTVNGNLIKCHGANCKVIDVSPGVLFVNQIDSTSIVSGYTGFSKSIDRLRINGSEFPIQLTDTAHFYSVVTTKTWRENLYIATNRNIFQFNGRQLRLFKETTFPVVSLSIDGSGNLWVGYLGGGVDFFTPQSQKPNSFPFFSGKSVTTVLQDAEGGYWFSTLENGVFHFPNIDIKLFKYDNESKISEVISDGTYVITGDYNGQIMRYSNDNFTPTLLADFPTAVLTMAYLKDELLVSTVGGLYRIPVHGNTPSILGVQRSIRDIGIDGNNAWTVSQFGIACFSNQGILKEKEVNFWARSICKNKARIIVGSITGVFETDTTLSEFKPIEALNNYKVHKMIFWKDWLLLATIGNGLVLHHDSVTRVFDIDHGFIANNVYSVFIEGKELFLGTEEGIVIVSLDSINEDQLELNYRVVNRLNGVPFDKNNFIAKTGNYVWSFYENGYTSLPIDKLLINRAEPRVYLRKIEVNNRPWLNDNQLDFGENNLKFEIGVISFSTRKIYFRHRISATQNWVDTKNATIEYFSLPAGDYQAELQYSTDQRSWRSLLIRNFSVLPPWWQTWYFQLLGVALVGLFLFLMISNRFKNLKIKEIAYRQFMAGVEQERTRLAGELHDNIGSHLSHLKHTNPISSTELDAIIQEVRNLSHDLAPPTAHIEGILPLLKSLIIRTQEKNEIKIELQIFDFVEVFSPDQAIQLFRMFQEILHNVTNHARAKSVDIQFFGYDDHVAISIEDDGIGFDSGTHRDGIGLSQLRLRAMLLGGRIEINSAPAQGVHILIEIPIKD